MSPSDASAQVRINPYPVSDSGEAVKFQPQEDVQEVLRAGNATLAEEGAAINQKIQDYYKERNAGLSIRKQESAVQKNTRQSSGIEDARVSVLNAQRRRAAKADVPTNAPVAPVQVKHDQSITNSVVPVVSSAVVSTAAVPAVSAPIYTQGEFSTADLNAIMLEAAEARRMKRGGVVPPVVSVQSSAPTSMARMVAAISGDSQPAAVVSVPAVSAVPVGQVAVSAVPVGQVAVSAPAKVYKPAVRPSVVQWSAIEGADIRDTLRLWAEQSGIEFVWNGSRGLFDVLETSVVQSSFEEAVRQLLDQYKGHFVRPVGKLFVNPGDGRRVLVVEVNRGA